MAIPLRLPGRPTPARRPTQPTTQPVTQPTARPTALRITVARAPRRVAWFAGFIVGVAAVLMAMAVILHTSIAERQLQIDRMERDLHAAQAEFDLLRADRAELRAPSRLDQEARALGMIPGRSSQVIAPDPMLMAIVIAQSGELPGGGAGGISSFGTDPLEQFRAVKSIAREAP